jgi:hypothetical protein
LGNPPAPLSIQGSRIVAGAGQQEVQFKGINMYGFNVSVVWCHEHDAHGVAHTPGSLRWLAAWRFDERRGTHPAAGRVAL